MIGTLEFKCKLIKNKAKLRKMQPHGSDWKAESKNVHKLLLLLNWTKGVLLEKGRWAYSEYTSP